MKYLYVHILFLFLASTFFGLWIQSIHTPCALDPLLISSPVNEAIQYIEKQFDGNTVTSIFRGSPRPEIDAAWERIYKDSPATRLTREQFLEVGGHDSTAVVKYRPQDGGGYMSQIDGYHHLHCLNLLRKYLRRDYYESLDKAFDGTLRLHLDHCIEIVRQKLMCTSDPTVILYDWVPGLDLPRANLNSRHQCVDFDRILDWSVQHSAHVRRSHVVKFGDATELLEAPHA